MFYEHCIVQDLTFNVKNGKTNICVVSSVLMVFHLHSEVVGRISKFLHSYKRRRIFDTF